MADTCRSCSAPIFWALTENGKRMPLDLEPVAGGVFYVAMGRDGELRCHTGEAPGFVRYTSHFATCPSAAEHRRSQR